jgi:hypothetical protein
MEGLGMKDKITIRGAPNAKQGLIDLIDYINTFTNTKNLTLVEIGCYVGDSTEIFAQHFGTVHAVDPWANGYDNTDAASFMHPMSIIEAQFDSMAYLYPNIKKHKMPSMDFAKNSFPEKFDVVYIDGIHTYTGAKNDITLFRNRLKPNGFLCGHDFQNRFPGVQKAVLEFGQPDKTFKDTSWLFRCTT